MKWELLKLDEDTELQFNQDGSLEIEDDSGWDGTRWMNLDSEQTRTLFNFLQRKFTEDEPDRYPYVERSTKAILEEREEWLKEKTEKWAKQDEQIERFDSRGIKWSIRINPNGIWIDYDTQAYRESNKTRRAEFCRTNCTTVSHAKRCEDPHKNCPIWDEVVTYINE